MRSFKPVEAVSRALRVLRVVNEEPMTSVAFIHKVTGLDKATIVRMLETLEHEGYVVRDPERRTYVVTGRTLLLSQGYDKPRWIGTIAEPTLSRFRNAIGWPSDIALFDQDAMVVIQTSRGQGPLSFNRQPGFRSPVLVTSIGLAYMAFCPSEERLRIIARLAENPDPWNDLAREPDRLQIVLDKVREQGFATMSEVYTEAVFSGSVWAIGVPIRKDDKLFATMNVMMLKSAVTLDDARKNLVKPLQAAADEIAEGLALSPPADA